MILTAVSIGARERKMGFDEPHGGGSVAEANVIG